jgi:large subunit ribosomal protein L28
VGKMSRMCDICGKKTVFGNNVSHSHKKTRRTFRPNIQKAKVEIKGKIKNINICTSCLKANKVKKVV